MHFTLACMLGTSAASAIAQVRVADDGRRIQHGPRRLVLVGDSGTQCVMQNLNIDYRAWIDDCAAARLNAIHIWSFVAPRQTQDAQVVEARYGYIYPGVTPWARRSQGPRAKDGLAGWDLRRFDEGRDPKKHYWPRLRDLCRHAARKNLLVGITVFFGWPKHPSDWAYHPFHVANGGFLDDDRPIIEATQRIAAPGNEQLEHPWSDSWSGEQKTQWVWERFTDKLLQETRPFGNTFFVFMDERSYPEGNCGDHFATFFRRRGAFWIDGALRSDGVDGLVDGHGPGRDINAIAANMFHQHPHHPFFEFELPPYQGDALRRNLYGCLLGGGHFFHHNDQGQETPTTGIMAYDPRVKDSRLDAVRRRLAWLGIACRILNESTPGQDRMTPRNDVLVSGAGYCLAASGRCYIAYIRSGGRATLRLAGSAHDYSVSIVNPRNGEISRGTSTARGSDIRATLPDTKDWVIVARRDPE